jgi:hypothetical protein
MATVEHSGAVSPDEPRDRRYQPCSSHWTLRHTWCFGVAVLLVPVLGLATPAWAGFFVPSFAERQLVPNGRLMGWALTAVVLLGIVVIAGHGITGRWIGLLINERNRMSLTRLQLIAWTVLVLSAIFAAALDNLAIARGGSVDTVAAAMVVAVPSNLWIAMGISTASLVAAPLVLRPKIRTSPNTEEMDATLDVLNTEKHQSRSHGESSVGSPSLSAHIRDRVDHIGQLVRNHCVLEADFKELFRGEELGNATYLDLGKLQMFLMTLVVLTAYALALAVVFSDSADRVTTLPSLHEGLVTLLGVSHAGFLTHEAVPHSQ